MAKASGIEIKIDDKKLKGMIKKHPKRADDWLAGVAQEMVNDIKLSFGTSPAGKTYKRGKKVHIASQPGYPPNVDTQALRGSINSERMAMLSYEIRDGVEYGYELEMGSEKVAPRPFMQPVFEEWRKKIVLDAKKNLKLT
tara:strand:+ start:737 stop:1156 length:420 start_codon:yes stop_codon:yes gene_type:complete